MITNALLGTDKMPLQIEKLPAVIAECLEKNPADSPETAFLRAATLYLAYKEVGKNPEKLTIPEPQRAPAETRTFCPTSFGDYFRENEDPVCRVLLPSVLEKCVEKNWTVPTNHLVGLLNIGKIKNQPENIYKNIATIAGEKGKWLAQFNSDWKYILVDEEVKTNRWEEGAFEERIDTFEKVRQESPALALEMLEKVWGQSSARERKAFLELMHINVSIADEAFLESVYDDIMKQKENDKGIKEEIKKIAIDLLISIPESKKYAWVWERLKTYFSKETKGNIKLNLPDSEDEFFCKEVMNKQLGRAKMSGAPDYFENAEYWFQELVALIKPQQWTAFFEMSVEDTVRQFQENFKGKVKEYFEIAYPALGHAILKHNAKEFVFEYLNQLPVNLENPLTQYDFRPLFSLISDPAQLDKMVPRHASNWISENMLKYFPPITWGMGAMERFMIFNCSQINRWGNNNYKNHPIFSSMKYLGDGVVDKVKAIMVNYEDNPSHHKRIEEFILVPIQNYFERKKTIEIGK